MSDAAFQDPESGPTKLDDHWQKQQKKTFTVWVNSHLTKRDHKIEAVEKDLSDGRMLIHLLEIIADDTLPKPARGNMRIHKIENVGKAFKFIKEKGVQLVSIAPEEIVDGNLKMILGMLWTLILRFEIQDIALEHMSAKDALLLWCQRKTEPYKNIDIQNFHMSWKDGLGFCGLIHRHRPELIDYESLRRDNPRENMEIAFETAEKQLGIPRMLDIDDMVDCIKPDERSVMTYIAAYYKVFSSFNQAEQAAKKIATVLETNREHERLIQEYETLASNLLEWILATIARFEERPNLQTVAECQAKLEEGNAIRSTEYMPKLKEKGELEAQYNTLQTKLRLSGRPPYIPSTGRMIQDINAHWEKLGVADREQRHWIVEELRRIQLAENKAERFRQKASSHDTWVEAKMQTLESNDLEGASLATVTALQKRHAAFQSDLAAHEFRVREIGVLANEIDELRYFDADAINNHYAAIYDTWQEIVQKTAERQTALAAAEERLRQLDEMFLEYAKQAPPVANFVELTVEKLTETYVADTVNDVVELGQGFEQLKSEIEQHSTEFDALKALHEKIIENGGSSNPYSPHDFSKIEQEWESITQYIAQREAKLNAEQEKQTMRENLRTQFAEKAEETNNWLTERQQELNALTESTSFDALEEQVSTLTTLQEAIQSYSGTFDELESLHNQIQEQLIFENPHTPHTMESLRGTLQQLSVGATKYRNELDNQILARDSKNISDEQMKEYRDSFKHFDKDNSGRLEHNEFRACLISVGYAIPQIPDEKDEEFKKVLARVDPNGDGVVSFDEFIAFMAEENADAENADQLLEAFRQLSNGQDYVLESDLQRELSPELFEYCKQNMTPFEGGPDGALDYSSFAVALYGTI